MGLYVEVPDKLGWLEQHGMLLQPWDFELKSVPFERMEKEGLLPVVVVDNGAFMAAAVAWCGAEYVFFANDTRQKCVYACLISDLKKVCPDWATYRGD